VRLRYVIRASDGVNVNVSVRRVALGAAAPYFSLVEDGGSQPGRKYWRGGRKQSIEGMGSGSLPAHSV
jgi:hypothetical protein